MKTKKCFKCGVTKALVEFYPHKQTRDGFLNKCKDCSKLDSKKQFVEIKSNPTRYYKERLRQAKKMSEFRKRTGIKSPRDSGLFRKKYPEKYKAHIASQRINCPVGKHKHHWSYRPEDRKDVFCFTPEEHARIHMHMTYDCEKKQFRRSDGSLISTRREAEEFYSFILSLKKEEYPELSKSSSSLTIPECSAGGL